MKTRTLVQLEAYFVRRSIENGREIWTRIFDVDASEADGVAFLCPKCYDDPPVGPVGCHSIMCWFVGRVPDDAEPKPGRWVPKGKLVELTFVGPAAASVAITGGCAAHFFVRNGSITP